MLLPVSGMRRVRHVRGHPDTGLGRHRRTGIRSAGQLTRKEGTRDAGSRTHSEDSESGKAVHMGMG